MTMFESASLSGAGEGDGVGLASLTFVPCWPSSSTFLFCRDSFAGSNCGAITEVADTTID